MEEVNRRGEFVFWRTYEGKHTLRREEQAGTIRWVDYIPSMPMVQRSKGDSSRSYVSRGMSNPGDQARYWGSSRHKDFFQIDQGTIEIVPAELGLSDSEVPEKWIFAIANGGQIIQAEPFDVDHGMHPICVIEPTSMGYGFGQPGISDFVAPFQDSLSWFINSHIDNVRSVLNNSFVVDPSRVEMQDLKNPGPGKLIRLKQAFYGQDVRTVLSQLQIQDVTGSHVKDFELFMRIADGVSSVTDNLRGLQDSGGRKTATEVRTSGEAGASRLAAMARFISSQGVVDLTEQMCLNAQQFLEDEFYIQVVGPEAATKAPLRVMPDQLSGDFYFPVHDGTLPMDKVAMLDVWKEIFFATLRDPELRQRFDIIDLFQYIAELGGAKNIRSFEIKQATPETLAQQAQAGNMVPLDMSQLGPQMQR